MTEPIASDALKSCCATLYASDWARLLLGASFHPGGLALTERLGALLDLKPDRRVLDVAAGRGASAIFLAQRFGCAVVGVEYSAITVAEANALVAEAGLVDRVRFEQGDAEQLPFDAGTFDAVICECAFCTFPNKRAAASEFARVLGRGGRAGLSDLTRTGTLPSELNGLLAWVACIGDARPIDEYLAYLAGAGLSVDLVEPHDEALAELVRVVCARLLGAELLVKLKQLDLPGADFAQAKALARHAAEAIRQGTLGYALVVGTK
jgi:arsenite methyltransferase